MSKFSQSQNYSWRKKFDNHDKLDNFIQESLNKFKFTKSHPELLKNISSLSHLILNSKPILPDLVIFSNPFNKNNCFYSHKNNNKYISFPRRKFFIDYSIKSKVNNNEKVNLIKSSEKLLNQNSFKSLNKEKKSNYKISSFSKSFKEKPYNFLSERNNFGKSHKNKIRKVEPFSISLNKNEYNSNKKNFQKKLFIEVEIPSSPKKELEKDILLNKENINQNNNDINENNSKTNDNNEEKKNNLSPEQLSEIKKEIQYAQYQNLFLLQQQYYLQYLKMQNLFNDILNSRINNDMKKILNNNYYNTYFNNNKNEEIKNENEKNLNKENDMNDPLMNDFTTDFKLYNPKVFLENPVLLVKNNLVERNWILIKENKIIINYNSDELFLFLDGRFKLGDQLIDYCIHDYQTDVVFQPLILYEILNEYLPKVKFCLWKNILDKNNKVNDFKRNVKGDLIKKEN